MSLVLDSSVTLAWIHGDEDTSQTRDLLADVVRDGAVVPSLWFLEVANSLQVAVRRGRISACGRDKALRDLTDLDIVTDPDTVLHAWSATLQLADLYGLTVYDAAYLELAQRLRLPLATLDGALAAAACKAGVPVVPEREAAGPRP